MKHPEEVSGDQMNRREFLIRSAKAGVTVAAAGALGYHLYDPKGPQSVAISPRPSIHLPDYSISGLERKMSVVYGEDRLKTINLAFTALGGIEKFIKPGDRVLLKVNAAFASPPILSATTNPDLIAEVARLCLQVGASDVVVSDNPINDSESCFSLTGIGEAARSAGARVIIPKASYFRSITLPGARLIRDCPVMYTLFEGITKVIGIAPVKDHHRSGASMTMKNWYGLIGGRRNIFHQNIHDFITELGLMIRPTLVILDGTTSMVTNGPTGGSLSDLKQTNTMIVSADQVAADAFGATLLGRTAQELPYLTKAEAAGVGTVNYDSLMPARVSIG
jgi:uncharacterized protein (DUF362 family)